MHGRLEQFVLRFRLSKAVPGLTRILQTSCAPPQPAKPLLSACMCRSIFRELAVPGTGKRKKLPTDINRPAQFVSADRFGSQAAQLHPLPPHTLFSSLLSLTIVHAQSLTLLGQSLPCTSSAYRTRLTAALAAMTCEPARYIRTC